MIKIKYKFNPETLKFEEEKFTLGKFIYKKVLPKIAFSVILGIGLGVVATYYIGSPAERDAKNENLKLRNDFSLLKTHLLGFEEELAKIQNRDDNVYRTIFEAKPVSKAERRGGFGGVDRYETYRGYNNSDLMVSTAYNLDVISREMIVQSKSFDEVVDLVKNKEKMLACIPSIQPIAVKDLKRFGSPFGMRFHPILHISRLHAGVDLTADAGTKIYASGAGTVVVSGVQNGYGNVVKINHGYGYMTVYGHCSKLLVEAGQKVNRGDVIALVGSTGLSTAPHLHYEVRINNTPVNPLNFYKGGLSEEEYQMLLNASNTDILFDEEN
ncbi:MAG: M23 family metallopeptidase [Bacteroidales bacterium]|nr:M23 family metallopeptidase [Bacteroidales bacterium]